MSTLKFLCIKKSFFDRIIRDKMINFSSKISLFLLSAVIIIVSSGGLDAQRTKSSQRAGEQRKAEKGLKDNRYFFYFINSSITNFGTEEEKKIYKEAIQRDILARLLYMKFLFHESFVEIRRSQEILIGLYKKIIDKDIAAAKNLLNDFASPIIRADLYQGRQYLRLGYRDTEIARTDMLMADNFRENLYSMRLYKYVRAIKSAKHARRYAFLSMIFVQANDLKLEPGRFKFDELKTRIEKISDAADKKDYYTTIHLDNYYKSKSEKSFFDIIWENPNLSEIPEFEKYMKIN